MAAHAITVFGVAEGDDEFMRLAVTSREMLQVERSFRGFSAQQFFQNVSVENLYKVAYVVLKMRGHLDAKQKFDEFVDEWSVMMNDPTAQARAKAIAERMAAEGASVGEINEALVADMQRDTGTDEDEGDGKEVDPTQAIA